MASAAIYYHPEAYTISGPKLMGRNAAGESFIKGFILHSNTDEYWLQVESEPHAKCFSDTMVSLDKNRPIKVVDKTNLGALNKAGTIYYPGPGIGEHAYHRAIHGHDAWSLCGITHTTSSARAMDSIVSLITSPVQPWDAVICTSNAVKKNVMLLLQAQTDYLIQRLGVQKVSLPLLPVIPLGIHTKDFIFTSQQKNEAKKKLGADQNTLIVLFMGRLSFHAKAHPLAMYQALEHAAQLNKDKKIVLVECGWHANEYIEKSYQDGAQLACPSVRVVTLDGREAANRTTAWASADIFCSLSDNIQETFGIVPIEAMAAGIPVVVSDWDGYKDTVRDGVDGFRIPTVMPGPGLGSDLAARHALDIDTYDMYCGHTCSLIAVDIDATSAAFSRLFQSDALRQKMGAAGRERAQEVYDWSVIIPQYESLWDEQNQMRGTQKSQLQALKHPWPARIDPFAAFMNYPTILLAKETKLALVDKSLNASLKRLHAYRHLSMVDFARLVIPSEEECEMVLSLVAKKATALEAIASIPQARQAFVFRALSWLLKLGIIKIIP